jgi:uncharacterized repeat protein (TIGR03833 family)
MAGTKRSEIHPGDTVDVVLKNDQATGRLTRGVVKEILTGSQFHRHGIKVLLTDGKVGRVKAILPKDDPARQGRQTPEAIRGNVSGVEQKKR